MSGLTKASGRVLPDQALAVPATPSSAVDGPPGFDPSRDVFAISSSACFCPEDDDPDNFDGRMITWTFAVPKDNRTGAGIYRLQFVRILSPEERGNTTAQLAALETIALKARASTEQSVNQGQSPIQGGGW